MSLVFQINLFARDALSLLTEISLPAGTSSAAEKRYAPLIDFMLTHVRLLTKWLPRDAFLLSIDLMWSDFVQVSSVNVCVC